MRVWIKRLRRVKTLVLSRQFVRMAQEQHVTLLGTPLSAYQALHAIVLSLRAASLMKRM